MSNVRMLRSEEALKAIEQVLIQSDNPEHQPPGGGGNGGIPLEARVAKLESAAEYIQRDTAEIKADTREIKSDMRTDFRLVFSALIAVALGLTAVMAKGFGWL